MGYDNRQPSLVVKLNYIQIDNEEEEFQIGMLAKESRLGNEFTLQETQFSIWNRIESR